jgi:16S rRNA (uracil1498-N3)-methyltransferase
MRLLLSERLNAPALRTILTGREMATAALAIGPEGGWTDEEIQCARSGKFVEASLGKLILRTETAVVAALACVNYAAA